MALRYPLQFGNSNERRQKASRAVREPRMIEKPGISLLGGWVLDGCSIDTQFRVETFPLRPKPL